MLVQSAWCFGAAQGQWRNLWLYIDWRSPTGNQLPTNHWILRANGRSRSYRYSQRGTRVLGTTTSTIPCSTEGEDWVCRPNYSITRAFRYSGCVDRRSVKLYSNTFIKPRESNISNSPWSWFEYRTAETSHIGRWTSGKAHIAIPWRAYIRSRWPICIQHYSVFEEAGWWWTGRSGKYCTSVPWYPDLSFLSNLMIL